jgi:hypothetical protein
MVSSPPFDEKTNAASLSLSLEILWDGGGKIL